MTVKFDFCSDLHVDSWHHTTRLFDKDSGPQPWILVDGRPKYHHIDWGWYKTPGARVLVIAGDLSNDLRDTADTIRDAARVYEHVVFVEGNHDHYQKVLEGSLPENQDALTQELSDLPNVTHLANGQTFLLDGVLFVGALGWYDWRAFEDRGITVEQARESWMRGIGDGGYVNFGFFKSPDVAALHDAETLRSLVLAAQSNDLVRDIVVVTHTSPRADLMKWIEGNDAWNNLTPSFVNTAMSRVLDVDTQGKIRHWIYGHTHFRGQQTIDGVTYSNNARGYPRECGPWQLHSHVVDGNLPPQ